jgi:hypothetical protein
MEGDDGTHEIGVDVVLVDDPRYGAPEPEGECQNLLVVEAIDPFRPDGRREFVVLLSPDVGLRHEASSLPDRRRGEGVPQEDLAGVEGVILRIASSRGALEDADFLHGRQAVRGDAGHDVRHARIGTHGNKGRDPAIPIGRIELELLQDPGALPGGDGTEPRAVQVAAARLEASRHDGEVVLRKGRVHGDVDPGEDGDQLFADTHIGLEGSDRGALPDGAKRARPFPLPIDKDEFLHLRVRGELERHGAPKSSGPEDGQLHGGFDAVSRLLAFSYRLCAAAREGGNRRQPDYSYPAPPWAV